MSEAILEPLPPREAIAALFARGAHLDPSFSWMDVWQEEHARAFTVAKSAGFDVLTDIHSALMTALSQGKTFRDFAGELRPVLEAKGWWGRKMVADPLTGEERPAQLGSTRRLRTIFDVNMRVSYAAGHWARFERSKDALPFLRYVHVDPQLHDPDSRPNHARLHNLVLPVDHPYWDRFAPPNGWGCRCTLQQLSQRQVDRLVAQGEDLKFEPPPVTERGFVNKRTGEVIRVPDGIDPGWDYNPGKAGFGRIEKELQGKLDGGLPFAGLPRQWPPAPATEAEVDKLAADLAEGQAQWEATLTTDEISAIDDYKGDAHQWINGALRADRATLDEMNEADIEATQMTIDEMRAALSRARLPKAITVFRGVPPDIAARYAGARPGDIIADPGFFSSSLSEKKAAEGFGKFIIEVRLKAGTRAAALVHFIPDVNLIEYEVIVAPNVRMRVVEIRDGRLIVEV